MRRLRLPAIPPVLREPNFARYLVASTVSSLGSGMSTVALAFAVLGMGGVTDLGIVLLAREIPLVVFVLLGGVFADRLHRRTILVSTDLIKAIAQGLTAVLFFSGNADLLSVVLLQTVFGIANAFSGPATTGLIREIASDEKLQEANALLSLSRSILSIAGPAIGALIVAAGSPALALAIDALTFLVSAVFTFSMRLPGVVRLATESLLADLRGGWQEFVQRRWAVAMVLSFGLFQLTYFPALNVLGPSVAQTELGGPASWGLILAIESVGAIFGGVVSLRLKVVRPLVACQLFVIPSGLLLIGLAVPLPLVVLVADERSRGLWVRRRQHVLADGPSAERARARPVAHQLVRLAGIRRVQSTRLRVDRALGRGDRDDTGAGGVRRDEPVRRTWRDLRAVRAPNPHHVGWSADGAIDGRRNAVRGAELAR